MIEKKRGSKPPLPAHSFFPAPKEIISILEPTALTDKGFRIGMRAALEGGSLKKWEICSGLLMLELGFFFSLTCDTHTTLLQTHYGLNSLG